MLWRHLLPRRRSPRARELYRMDKLLHLQTPTRRDELRLEKSITTRVPLATTTITFQFLPQASPVSLIGRIRDTTRTLVRFLEELASKTSSKSPIQSGHPGGIASRARIAASAKRMTISICLPNENNPNHQQLHQRSVPSATRLR